MGFEKINEDTYVCDDGHGRFFLIVGETEALLIDSGMQITNAKELVQELTDKPVKLFNTHTDRDHIGSNAEFDQIMMNPAELVNYEPEHTSQKIIPVFDGDIIDIGNRPLKAIALPGHTPGSTALLDLNSGMLFSGDPIQRNGRIFMFGPMRDISAYILSLERLLALNDEIKEIYPCHGTYPVGMDVVSELIAGAKKIESREIIPTIIEVFGTNVAEYDIGGNVLLCDAQEKECPQEE